MPPELKIYVWPNFDRSTGGSSGFAVAIARDQESAIAMVEEDSGIAYDIKRWGEVQVSSLREMAYSLLNSN